MKINSEIITSRNNPLVKWASSLADKKGREAAKCFIAEGEKLALEAVKSNLLITHFLILESRRDYFLEKLSAISDSAFFENCELVVLSESAFLKISTEKAPQGIITIIKYLDFFRNMDIIYKEEFILDPLERSLALCSVRDPLNLGSVIRSAVAFGVEHIVLTADCADIYNPKTVRSAMGSLFKISVSYVKDFSSFIKSARAAGRRVFAAELTDSAIPISNVGLIPSDILLIGNEGHGISAEISELCDSSIYIPISNKTESLNASVAAAIFMWEQEKSQNR